jgi:hypothetical protein
MALILILFPLLASGAALEQDALSDFQRPGVPPALYAKVERGFPLTLPDVVILTKADVSKGAIIIYLYRFGEHFRLTPADFAYLQREDISGDLIEYMASPDAHPSPIQF